MWYLMLAERPLRFLFFHWSLNLKAHPNLHGVVSQKKNATTIAVEVRKSQHKYVIGPRGNTLQEILDKTGVSVEIPPSDSSSETVILRGEPDRLGQALTEVYAKVRNLA